MTTRVRNKKDGPSIPMEDRVAKACQEYQFDPTRNVQFVTGDAIRNYHGWYRHDRVVYRGVPLEGMIQTKKIPMVQQLHVITVYKDACVHGSHWLWLLKMNKGAGLNIPIKPGDHVKGTLTGTLAFVIASGSIPFGKQRIPGYRVRIGENREDFFDAESTQLLWTVEEMREN